MTDLQDIADVLYDNDEFEVIFHINPDGDAVGSAFALALALRMTGKKAQPVCTSAIPDNYLFLTDRVDKQVIRHPKYICVDTSTAPRLGEYSDKRILCCIDHHENNTVDASYKYTDPSASSCAEIVYELIQLLGAPVSALMADFLYTGLVTDTSCFRSVSVNTDSLRHAAIFAACGADASGLSRRFFLTKSPKRMAIEGRLRQSMKIFDGRVAGFVLPNSDYTDLDITDSDVEGINDIAEEPENIKVGIVVREKRKGICRISVRCAKGYRADLICAEAGGGGHANAAGASMDGDPQTVLDKMAKIALNYLDRHDTLI